MTGNTTSSRACARGGGKARFMTEMDITRRMLRRALRGSAAASPLAKDLLDFGRTNGRVLFDLKATEARKLTWTALKRAVADDGAGAAPGAGVLALARDLSGLLRLDAVDRLVHHATIFEMNVESYRRRAALQRQSRAGRPPTYATIKSTEELSRSDNQTDD